MCGSVCSSCCNYVRCDSAAFGECSPIFAKMEFLAQFLELCCQSPNTIYFCYFWPNMKRSINLRSPDVCEQCLPAFDSLEKRIHDICTENAILKKENSFLLSKCATLRENLNNSLHTTTTNDFASVSVISEEILPENLQVGNFGTYFEELVDNYPFLLFLTGFLFSLTHRRKENATNTPVEWLNWSSFYKSFICEMLLRTKQGKAVLRLPILIALVFLYTKVPEPAWRLMQKLKVVVSRHTLENWIKSQPPPIFSALKVLLFSFDNCDFYRHITNVRQNHRSTMIHTCVQLIVDFRQTLEVFGVELWNLVEKADFVDFVSTDFDFAIEVAKNAWKGVKEVYKHTWLKFAHVDGTGCMKIGDLTILSPIIPCNTSTYKDVQEVLEKFFRKFVEGSERTFVFVNTDQACHALVWGLKMQFPSKFSWVVPVPGEWHWTWHILKGIFRIYGKSHFVPWSVQLNYSSLDVECKSFHYAEDFLQIVTLALVKFVKKLMKSHQETDPLELLHMFHKHTTIYELIYMLIYYLCPYWFTRSAIKHGISAEMDKMWRYWLHLFICTRKWKYVQLTIRFLYILQSLHPSVAQLYNNFRVFSFSGEKGSGIPYDGLNELVMVENSRIMIAIITLLIPHIFVGYLAY